LNFKKAYARSVNSSNLQDSERHYSCEPLAASGWASRDISGLGAILLRILWADGNSKMLFESGCRNFSEALRIWLPMVRNKGEHRKWHKGGSTPRRDAASAEALYVRVGQSALAYFLDDRCGVCEGAGVDSDRRTCIHCKGTGKAELLMKEPDKGIALDLVSDLQEIVDSHSTRAVYAMREQDLSDVAANARQIRV